MKLRENVQKVSLIFFLIVGLVHIVAYLMNINGFYEEISGSIRKVLEIPFIMIAAIYGIVSLQISLSTSEKRHKISGILMTVILIAIFASVIYLNLFIPDRI